LKTADYADFADLENRTPFSATHVFVPDKLVPLPTVSPIPAIICGIGVICGPTLIFGFPAFDISQTSQPESDNSRRYARR